MNDNYELERITDRMERARIIMDRQLRASEINASLCNYINETRDPSITAKVVQLAETDPELHRYIKRLEMISVGIYCTKCDTPKYVPGFNEVAHTVSPSAADELKRVDMENTERKLNLLRADIQDAIESMNTTCTEIMSYYKKILAEMDKYSGGVSSVVEASDSLPQVQLQPQKESLKDIFEKLASRRVEFDAEDKFNDFPGDASELTCDFLTEF